MPDLFFADRVLESTTGVGAGPVKLEGPLPGYRSFVDAGAVSLPFAYTIVSQGVAPQWEVGIGTLVPDGEGFALSRIADISSQGPDACDFVAGTKTIALTVSANWFSQTQAQAALPVSQPPIMIAPEFQNGWSNFASFAAPVRYYRAADGRVYLSGNIGGGTGGNNVILFRLPENMKPTATEYFTARNSGTTSVVAIYIRSNGDVVLQSGSPSWFSLSGINFLAAS